MSTEPTISQRGRLGILLLYILGLFVTSWFAFGTWVPLTSEKGIWLYSALAAVLLGSLLVTPYFTSPANAVSYAVAAGVALLAANTWYVPRSTGFDRFIWSAACLYIVVVILAALVAIAFKDSPKPTVARCARSSFLLARAIGTPRGVFSAVFFFALITYHRTAPREYITISLAWAAFVGMRPLENAAGLWKQWRDLWRAHENPVRLGEVVGHETPGLVLIREDPGSTAAFGDMLLVRSESGLPGLAMALDHVGFASGCWLRSIHLTPTGEELSGDVQRMVAEGSVFLAGGDRAGNGAAWNADDAHKRLLGFVAADSNVGQLQVEVVRADLDIHEGILVEVAIRDQRVLYQVIKGLTREEVLQEKNTRGFVRAQAKKIGTWNRDHSRFEPVPWLPQPNEPVLLAHPEQQIKTRDAIGHFPGTTYPVRIDPHLLVTHNAAILGILGVGKSFLAIELVERMIDAGIKVLCLDLTNQYAKELSLFHDAPKEAAFVERLRAIGQAGKENYQKNVEEGGSIREFSAAVRKELESFLEPSSSQTLRVLNPVECEIWRQDSKPFQGIASMATLTPTEVTRIITETTLGILREQGIAERARCCIVYEEAHSLVPEWNAVASEGDKTATNGTAKAILQGRKFGLGCLVITQRTANVTKSILNQCNTVFGLRVFDATGMEFLKNYIGEDYAGVLSTLEDRHAVVFGRASSCHDPVLVRLNDRGGFVEMFRRQTAVAPKIDGAGG